MRQVDSYKNIFPEYGLNLKSKKEENIGVDTSKLQKHFKSHNKLTHVNYWNLDEISIIE
jgi:hypothetical protein